jgi:hypothetical protein
MFEDSDSLRLQAKVLTVLGSSSNAMTRSRETGRTERLAPSKSCTGPWRPKEMKKAHRDSGKEARAEQLTRQGNFFFDA